MLACVLQEISKLESELSNLESQIEMQTNNVQVKDGELTALQDEVNHVSHTKRICRTTTSALVTADFQ